MAKRLQFNEIPPLIEKNIIISETILEIFKNLQDDFDKSQNVSDENLSALSAVFGETLGRALDLVESNCVSYFHTSEEAVGIYQVEGSSGNIYTIYPSVNYCPCESFKYQVACGSFITCKHVLASMIANVLKKVNSVEVTPAHFNDMLLGDKMNERQDWHSRNPFMDPFMYPSSDIVPALCPAANWVHVPPQTMPWGLPPSSHPSVMRFTAGDIIPYPSHHPVKRKPEPDVELPPPKQLVTEEKMAAHMSNLHISDIESSTQTDSQPASQVANISCDDDAMEHERLPRLVVSDELKNLKTDPIIPQSILSSLERPKMALVLWQPPAGDIGAKLREAKKQREEDEEKEKEMSEVNMETAENNNVNTFRPIDPVPMLPNDQSHYLQPTPQFQPYYPFS